MSSVYIYGGPTVYPLVMVFEIPHDIMRNVYPSKWYPEKRSPDNTTHSKVVIHPNFVYILCCLLEVRLVLPS